MSEGRTIGRRFAAALGVFALVVVVVAPAAASWRGLVAAGHDALGLPGAWALLVPLTLDAAAFYAAALSLRSVLSGDSAFVDRVLVWVYAAGSAALNVWHADAVGGVPAAVFYGVASVSAVLLWDRTLRAIRRDALRELGSIEAPAPRFRALRWVLRPRETARAWALAIAEGITSPAEALARSRPAVEAPADPSPRAEGAGALPPAELGQVSKAEAVRRAFAALGTHEARPVVRWLADRGVEVGEPYVYDVRRRMTPRSEHVEDVADVTPARLAVVGGDQ